MKFGEVRRVLFFDDTETNVCADVFNTGQRRPKAKVSVHMVTVLQT